MMIGDALSYHHDCRVALIDLDAQANLSRMTLGYGGVKRLSGASRSLTFWMQRLIASGDANMNDFYESNATGLQEVRATQNQDGKGSLGIVCADPQLRFAEIEYDHRFYEKENPAAPRLRMAGSLGEGLNSLGDGYELVVFDCPPGFTTLAQAALVLADAIITPIFEEQLSFWSLMAFRDDGLKTALNAWDLKRHRVLFSKVASQHASDERRKVRVNVSRADFTTFNSYVRETSQSHRWMHREEPASVKPFARKYGPVKDQVKRVGDEVVGFLKDLKPKDGSND
jgi:cellulose biosynthesis protein BcsQ